MVSSARSLIVILLLILTGSICAKSQTVPEKTATISGRVTMKGNSVSGIVVGMVLTENYRSQVTHHTAATDADGNYRIANVPPGSYEVVVSAPVYVAARRPLIISKAETIENMDFALVRGGVITGKVTDSEGRLIIETEVRVIPVQMEERFNAREGIRTDDRGIYRAFGLKAGKYRVSAGSDEAFTFGVPWARSQHKLTYHPATGELSAATIIEVTEGSEATNVDVTLARATSLYSAAGRIVDGESGRPLAGVNYGVHRYGTPSYGGSRSGGMVTNSNGEFKLHNLAPGEYGVTGQAPPDSDWRVEPLPFQIVDRDVTGLEVKTSKGATVSGVIVLDGPDSRVIPELNKHHVMAYTWTSNRTRGSNHAATVNPDGSFHLRGLPGGQLSLMVWGPERLQVVRLERDGIAQTQGIEIKDLEQVTGVRVVVDYPTGAIRGSVKSSNGSIPADSRYSVRITRTSAEVSGWNSLSTAHVDPRGNFMSQGLLPGTYEVALVPYLGDVVISNQPALATQQVVVTMGNVSSVTLTLPQN